MSFVYPEFMDTISLYLYEFFVCRAKYRIYSIKIKDIVMPLKFNLLNTGCNKMLFHRWI